MNQNFNDCLNRLLKDEGGYSNVPGDNGGPTNYGITLADYRKYINPKGTAASVKGMSVDDAKRIYRTKYWNALNCDSLSSGVDYTVFDYGVNSGLGRPQKALQRFKGQTGSTLIDSINNERMTFLKGLAASQAHDAQFLKGWLARVQRVRNYSHYLAANPPKPNTAGTLVATVLASAASAYHWGLNHWHLVAIATVATGLAAYGITHLIHKAKQ